MKQNLTKLIIVLIGLLLMVLIALLLITGCTSTRKSQIEKPKTPDYDTRNYLQEGVDIQSKLPDNLAKSILIIYDPNDENCVNIFPELNFIKQQAEFNNDKTAIYYVNIFSDKGRELNKAYNISEVPSVLYVFSDGSSCSFESLLYQDKTLSEAAIDRAIITQRREMGIDSYAEEINPLQNTEFMRKIQEERQSLKEEESKEGESK